jgi:hypothetical protein
MSLCVCEAANINQEFANEDIPALLEDLGHLIEAEQVYRMKSTEVVRFRLTKSQKETIQKKANTNGYNSMSEFLKHIALAQ